VKGEQGGSGQFGGGHGDKGVPSGLVCGRIEHQANLCDAANPGEQEPQACFGDARGEVADIQPWIHVDSCGRNVMAQLKSFNSAKSMAGAWDSDGIAVGIKFQDHFDVFAASKIANPDKSR
jgi:hypothetical protein